MVLSTHNIPCLVFTHAPVRGRLGEGAVGKQGMRFPGLLTDVLKIVINRLYLKGLIKSWLHYGSCTNLQESILLRCPIIHNLLGAYQILRDLNNYG